MNVSIAGSSSTGENTLAAGTRKRKKTMEEVASGSRFLALRFGGELCHALPSFNSATSVSSERVSGVRVVSRGSGHRKQRAFEVNPERSKLRERNKSESLNSVFFCFFVRFIFHHKKLPQLSLSLSQLSLQKSKLENRKKKRTAHAVYAQRNSRKGKRAS